MNNIDYIKEKLNTLRIEFMAHILVLIALGSGLSKMYLDGYTLQNYTYTVGVVLFCIIFVSLVFVFLQLKNNVKLLKDKK